MEEHFISAPEKTMPECNPAHPEYDPVANGEACARFDINDI